MKMKKHFMKFKGGHKHKKGHHCGKFGKALLLASTPDGSEDHDFHHRGRGFHKRQMMRHHHFKHHFQEDGFHGFQGCHGKRGLKKYGHHKHGHHKRGFIVLLSSSSSDSDDSGDSREETAPHPRENETSAPNEDLGEPSAPTEEFGESSAPTKELGECSASKE